MDLLSRKEKSNHSANYNKSTSWDCDRHLEGLLENCDNFILDYDVIEKQKGLEILIPFDVQESHMIETRVSKPPKVGQLEELKKQGIEFKIGQYHPKELSILRSNWKYFCEHYGFDQDAPQYFLPHPGGVRNLKRQQKLNFVRVLGRGLDHRSLFCIYTKFQTLYTNQVKGRFENKEDQIIVCYMNKKNHRHCFSMLGTMLNRSSWSIKKRYVQLKAGVQAKKWDEESVTDMLNTLMQVMGVHDVEGLRSKDVPFEVWDEVSKILQTDWKRLRFFWLVKLSTQLFAKHPIYFYSFTITLLMK